jgi:hypothetical protein
MNIYSLTFHSTCPRNHERITYHLTIQTEAYEVILAEELEKITGLCNDLLHEDMADMLFEKFGNKQCLVAKHGNTTIKTFRGNT